MPRRIKKPSSRKKKKKKEKKKEVKTIRFNERSPSEWERVLSSHSIPAPSRENPARVEWDGIETRRGVYRTLCENSVAE